MLGGDSFTNGADGMKQASPKTGKAAETIDAYIGNFPPDTRVRLQQIRQVIRAEAPEATETISYQIPTFKLNGRSLVYFSAWKTHLAIYPIPRGDAAFRKKIAPHVAGKGTLRFASDRPLPLALIRDVVRSHLRSAKERERAATKAAARKTKPRAKTASVRRSKT
jgi:uncharacterized protein YdhG (YjbR/CyaY superfamily)